MKTLQELIAQRDALEEQIKKQTHAQRGEAIEKIKALMEESGITFADLSGRKGAGQMKTATRGGNKVAPKYRDESGNSWSGRGLAPRWLKAAMAQGKKREDFAV